MVVHVELLDDSCGVFDNLGIIGCRSLRERLDNLSYHHLLELFSALLVNAQITNGEQSDSSGRLRRPFVVRNHVQ